MHPVSPRRYRGFAILLMAAAVGCQARETPGPAPAPTRRAKSKFPDAKELLRRFERGQPWERVRAKVIRARRIQAITVHATVRLRCPSVRLVRSAPVPKDTGLRTFGKLDLIETDTITAHHVEAALIEAEEIIALEVRSPARTP